MTNVSRGLELRDMDSLSEGEVENFGSFYTQTLGHRHIGLDYWLQNRPDVLKRYREYSDVATPRHFEEDLKLTGFGFVPFYAVIGYDVGVRYAVHMSQRAGMTKQQVLDGIAVAFLVGGPCAMETVANALESYEWIQPAAPAAFPDGWSATPERLASGMDFTERTASPEDLQKATEWYLRMLGEIPPYVGFLIENRPDLLKAYRKRYENCLREVPTQCLPTTLLHFNVIRGFEQGIRENVLLCRSLGVAKETTLNVISSASLNGGMDAFSIVSAAAGDVFRSWDVRSGGRSS